jgi:hypothetical protein
MADEPDTSATEDKNDPNPEADKETPEDLGEAGKKALTAERKRAAQAEKQAKELAARLKEIEDKDKSEVDKLRDELEAAKRDAETARKDALRLKVGTDKGLPRTVAMRLQGDSEEEMAADADALLAELKPGVPSGDADGGKRGGTPDPKTDMNALLRAAARGS